MRRFTGAVALLLILILFGGCVPKEADTASVEQMPKATASYGSQPALATQPTGQNPLPTTAPPTRPAATTQASQRVMPPSPPKAGEEAFDFTLSDLQGNKVSLSSLRGKKVMLNFWATWCGPCRVEIPHMVKLYNERHAQGFEILAVNLTEDQAKVSAFVKQFEMTFPVLLDTKGMIGGAYYVRGIPTSVFIDEEGVIQNVHVGTLTDKLLRDYVDQLMK